MGVVKRTIDDFRLYCRYACRRCGLPGYQIHQIYLPEQQLIYIPIPKNACTSIKHALHEMEFGKRFDSDLPEFSDYKEHHDYYKKRRNAFTSVSRLRINSEATRFALVRDPVKRLISCYRNRVVDLEDLHVSRGAIKQAGLPIQPDLNTFILNLETYRSLNKSIEHHSRPQAQFLGGTIDYLDRVFTMREIPELLKMLKKHKPSLELRKRKTGGTKLTLEDLSQDALEHALTVYKEDYELLSGIINRDDLLKAYDNLHNGQL